jgi:hypothetical protein
MTSHPEAGLAELRWKGYGRSEERLGEGAGLGVLMIVLSLASAGVVADYIAENDLLTAPNQSIALFGSHVAVSGVAVVIVPFALGALSAALFVIGMGLIRGSSDNWRAMKRRVAELEWEITSLRSKLRLSEVVKAEKQRHIQLPEAEPETEQANLDN